MELNLPPSQFCRKGHCTSTSCHLASISQYPMSSLLLVRSGSSIRVSTGVRVYSKLSSKLRLPDQGTSWLAAGCSCGGFVHIVQALQGICHCANSTSEVKCRGWKTKYANYGPSAGMIDFMNYCIRLYYRAPGVLDPTDPLQSANT